MLGKQVRAPCDRFLKEELLDVQIAANVSLPSQDAGAVRSDCRLTDDGFRTGDDRNGGALLTAMGPGADCLLLVTVGGLAANFQRGTSYSFATAPTQ